jgi:hypothetical protein
MVRIVMMLFRRKNHEILPFLHPAYQLQRLSIYIGLQLPILSLLLKGEIFSINGPCDCGAATRDLCM